MVKDVMFGKTMRKSYAKYEEILEIPNMLKIQKDSYEWFLETGLREVFKDVGTITDFSGKLELSFLDYTMEDKPKYTIEELSLIHISEPTRLLSISYAVCTYPLLTRPSYHRKDPLSSRKLVKFDNGT